MTEIGLLLATFTAVLAWSPRFQRDLGRLSRGEAGHVPVPFYSYGRAYPSWPGPQHCRLDPDGCLNRLGRLSKLWVLQSWIVNEIKETNTPYIDSAQVFS